MSKDRSPYAIRRSNRAEPPRFEVLCLSENPLRGSPLSAVEMLLEDEIEALIWRRGIGFDTVKRRGKWLSLTRIFSMHGWSPISARPGWRTDYSCLEWWHFQNDDGLMDGQTTFGDELLKIYPPSLVTSSGLPQSAVWRDGCFR